MPGLVVYLQNIQICFYNRYDEQIIKNYLVSTLRDSSPSVDGPHWFALFFFYILEVNGDQQLKVNYPFKGYICSPLYCHNVTFKQDMWWERNSHEIFKCGCFIPYCSQTEWEFVLHPGKGNSVIIYSNLLKLFQTCVSFFLLLNTKMIFWEMQITEQVLVPTDVHTIFFHFFQISCFIFSRIKKLIQVWNNMRVNYDKFNFGVNYPFIPMTIQQLFDYWITSSNVMSAEKNYVISEKDYLFL